MSNKSPLRIAGFIVNEYNTRAAMFGCEPLPDFRPMSPQGRLLMRVSEQLLKEVLGCQKCGGRRMHYIGTEGNDATIRLGTLEVCLDCGQIQGEWPYHPETGESE